MEFLSLSSIHFSAFDVHHDINSPEQKYKNIEKKIVELLEESILASTGSKPDVIGGLSKAKEASSMDRTLLRMRNQNGGNFTHNFDLTYSVSSIFIIC